MGILGDKNCRYTMEKSFRKLEQNAVPADWKPAKRRQKDLDASGTRKHGKSHHGYKFTVSVDLIPPVFVEALKCEKMEPWIP
jgi:hypothetical protein